MYQITVEFHLWYEMYKVMVKNDNWNILGKQHYGLIFQLYDSETFFNFGKAVA